MNKMLWGLLITGAFAGVGPQTIPLAAQAAPPPGITKIEVVGGAVKIFDHTQKVEPLNLTDGPLRAWREADGTVNLMMISPECYRLRGPDLLNLTFDPNKIFSSYSSGDQIPEDLYNTWHWFGNPYSPDGRNIFTLAHSEWYPDLLMSGATIGPNGEGINFSGFCVTANAFVSSDGGASWGFNWVNGNRIVAKEAHHWTGTPELAAKAYLNTASTGLDLLTGLVKEGAYYYALGNYSHVDFSQNPAPVDRAGMVLARTNDYTNPNGWQAWSGGSTWDLISNHNFKVFLPQEAGVDISVWPMTLLYDTNAQVYILGVNGAASNPYVGTPSSPVGYVTTPSLANPTWSSFAPIVGVPQVDPGAFWPYATIIDPTCSGYNFDSTSSGSPYLFWDNDGPLVNGHHVLANRSDLYRAQLKITYGVPPPPPPPPQFNIGDRVAVINGAHNLRTGPNSALPVVAQVPQDAQGTITGGPAADQNPAGPSGIGLFYQVTWDNGAYPTGWIYDITLGLVAGAPPAPPPPPAPQFNIGDRVAVINGAHNIRTGPNSALPVVAQVPQGAQGTITGGPVADQNPAGPSGIGLFYQVTWDNGAYPTGWIYDVTLGLAAPSGSPAAVTSGRTASAKSSGGTGCGLTGLEALLVLGLLALRRRRAQKTNFP